MFRNIILLTLFVFSTSCSLYKSMVSLPKYSIVTSTKGANVYNSKGRLLGQTPLKIGYKDIQDGLDGEFVTLILEKDGFLSRVVFFEAERSVELKIDLKRDEFFQDNKYNLLKGRNDLLTKENMFLKEKLLSTKDIMEQSKIRADVASTQVQIPQTVKEPAKKKVKIVKTKKTRKKNRVYRKKNLRPELINKFLTIQNLINNRNFPQARHDLFEIDKKHPNLVTTLNLLAYIELEKGNYGSARKFLERTTMLKRNDAMTERLYQLLYKLDSSAKEEVKK